MAMSHLQPIPWAMHDNDVAGTGIIDELPPLRLIDLPGGANDVVLCASARLALDLRRAHGEARLRDGADTWQALQSATPTQWLDHLTSAALLRGELPPAAMPGRLLTRPQAQSLWTRAVARDAALAGIAELFDGDGLAQAAAEADSLCQTWRITVPEAEHTAESRAFLRWREAFAQACRNGDWRTAEEAMRWRIDCVARGIGELPARIAVAGFTAPEPWLSRLLAVLAERGAALYRLDFGHAAGAARVHAGECADAAAECRAVAAWARERLQQNPRARLRIAAADLPARRAALTRALDAALHADAVGADWAALARDHALVMPPPLAEQPLIDVALQLLRLAVGAREVPLSEFGALLCGPGWSADVDEADARAQLEARLRELTPPEAPLARLHQLIVRCTAQDMTPQPAPQLIAHLDALLNAGREWRRQRQTPGDWGARFAQLLTTLGWPGQRVLLPAEQAACAAWQELLSGLAQLDALLGAVDAGEALRLLQRQCREQGYAAPRRVPARVELCTLADALAGPVDGLWLLGMTADAWPPAPRPNPLLPADLQRRAGVPSARVDGLTAQARALLTLWCASANEVVVSWPAREGEKTLRASPLLADLAARAASHTIEGLPEPDMPATFAAPANLQRIADARAPAVGEDEMVRGGTSLLQAQALCPAWAFYRYRLGAAVLPAPTFGLDARARGDLLHRLLAAFWNVRAQADLLRMNDVQRAAAIDDAAATALAGFQQRAVAPLSDSLQALEKRRLARLLEHWLSIERTRMPFRVAACEEKHTLTVAGLSLRVVVDRIDALDDGRLLVLDYKSGRYARADGWAQPRLREPQLPLYAALVLGDKPVAAVALARVTMDTAGFVGVAEEDGLLPEVKSLAAQQRRYASADFPDWAALRRRWAAQIEELAGELRDGVAAVVFEKDSDLQYCDVLPLLRIAERETAWAAENLAHLGHLAHLGRAVEP